MVLYPLKKKKPQRLGVGDQTGVFTTFGLNDQFEATVAFSTSSGSPTAAGGHTKPVTSAYLFGDQLFFIRGDILDAYSKKGKHFFSANTNATEKIHSVFIDTPFIIFSGDFMTTTMKETKELGFYMCPDRIHQMCTFVSAEALSLTERSVEHYVTCLACNDRTIRLVVDTHLVEELGCEAPVVALLLHQEQKNKRYLIYGTQVGSIGFFKILENNSLRRYGNYVPPSNKQTAITAFCAQDIDSDKMTELIVGYEDGTLQVFRLSKADSNFTLELLWTSELGEKVMSIVAGMLTEGSSDIAVHLFSGTVVCFTLQQDVPSPKAAPPRTGPSQLQLMATKKSELEKEMLELKNKINATVKELAVISGAMEKKAPVVAVASLFKASVALRPLEGKPLLSLTINSDVPLDGCILKSSINTRFIATKNSTVTHSVVGTANHEAPGLALVSPVEDGSVIEGAKQLEVHLWADEGQAGVLKLELYAVPKPRTSQEKTIQLTALPLYARVASVSHLMTPEEAPFVLSQITFSGTFHKTEVHLWLTHVLPGVEHLHQVSPVMYFASDYLLSVLIIEVQVNEDTEETTVAFTSDSLVALSAVKDVVTLLAAEKKRELRIKENYLYGSVDRRLRKLKPVMEQCSAAIERALMLKGLQELQSTENDLDYLPDSLKLLLSSSESVLEEAKTHEEYAQYVQRAVISLYKAAVTLLRHLPPLNPEKKKILEEAAAGKQASYSQLETLFFPKEEHKRERTRLETQGDTSTFAQGLVQSEGAAAGVATEVAEVPSSPDLPLSASNLVSSPSDEDQEL